MGLKFTCPVNDLTLNEFVVVRKLFCKLHHRDTTPEECSRCHPLICLSERICSEGICELPSLYREVFPTLQYQSDKAVRKLMQLPVAIFKLEFSGPGSQRLCVRDSCNGRLRCLLSSVPNGIFVRNHE